MNTPRPSPARASVAALAACAGLLLGGCHADRIVADTYPTTYKERHPIVLAEGAERLDLPVGAGPRGLTERQRQDIRAFVAGWRSQGRGPIGMMVPSGDDYAAPAIKTTLASAGVPAGQIVAQRYKAEAGEVSIVKLGYVKLKAGLPHKCGYWPEDLGGAAGDFYTSSENRDYWNFGCATQANLAAQLADPEDLARPRAETPSDAVRRGGVMQKYRNAEDTSTRYEQKEAVVSEVGK